MSGWEVGCVRVGSGCVIVGGRVCQGEMWVCVRIGGEGVSGWEVGV